MLVVALGVGHRLVLFGMVFRQSGQQQYGLVVQ